MTNGSEARRVAIDALVRIERDNAFANLAMDSLLKKSGLDQRDRGLVTELVYGSLRRRRSLDYLVDRFLSSDPPQAARAALRVGAYQLRFTDIPPHAAVSSTVEAVPKKLRGLVNAVLRRVADAPVNWPDDATRLSYPDWIVERLVSDLGADDAMASLEAMNSPIGPTTREDGYTQDEGSQLVAAAVPVATGEVVWDACAAPGGKATALAARGARVIAGDLRAKRVGLVAKNARKLDAALFAVSADGTKPPIRPGSLDAVLIDAPCSGLGVLHRRADARWRIQPDDLERLAALQRRLIAASVPLVRPGGSLTYSVCTLSRAETIEHAEWVAAEYPHLEPLDVPDGPWQPWGSGAILLPQTIPSDGMAIFRWLGH